jgi:osmotically inducible protein OsmC
MKRKANARWQGTAKEGAGTLTTQSGVLNDTPYSFVARFGDGKGTNPEELVAAAHAGCFTMALSFMLNGAGFTADAIDTEADLTMDRPTARGRSRHPSHHARAGAQDRRCQIRRARATRRPIAHLAAANATITLDAALVA